MKLYLVAPWWIGEDDEVEGRFTNTDFDKEEVILFSTIQNAKQYVSEHMPDIGDIEYYLYEVTVGKSLGYIDKLTRLHIILLKKNNKKD